MKSRWITSRCGSVQSRSQTRPISSGLWSHALADNLLRDPPGKGAILRHEHFLPLWFRWLFDMGYAYISEKSRGMQTEIMFVTYNGPTTYAALHFYLSPSSSRRMARIVMDSGDGIWDKRVVPDWEDHGSTMKKKYAAVTNLKDSICLESQSHLRGFCFEL